MDIFYSLTYSFLIFGIYCNNNIELNVIVDIINSYIEPPAVTIISCNKKDFAPYLKTFSVQNILSRVHGISSFGSVDAISPLYSLYILDISCKNASSVLEKADEFMLFASPNRWMLLLHKINEERRHGNIQNAFDKVNILPDSDVMVVSSNGTELHRIHKIYKPGVNSEIIFENFAIWDKQLGYQIIIQDLVSANRRKDLKGITLSTSLVITHNDSLNHLLDKRDRHIDSIAKVNYVFMLHLSDMLNIKMKYTIQSTWGYKNESEWSGMIGELTRREADIGGTPLFLTTDRVDIIDYIAMTTPTKSKFVFRQPKLSYITNVFTLPFETTVWISSIALVLLTAVVLYLLVLWESHKFKLDKNNQFPQDHLEPSFLLILSMAIGAVCQQGSSAVPHAIPGRIVTIILFTSLMFLYTSYSANIVALLQSSSTSIQSLDDLLKSRLQVGVDDTVFNHFYFPNATEPVRKAIYRQKVAPPGQSARFYAIEEGVRRMRQGLFAFHMETGAGYKLVGETFLEDEKCGLQEIQYLQVPDPWLAIQKNSSYKEMLKIALRKIHESGIQNREVSLLYTKKPECTSRGSSFVGVGIVDCYPAAMIIAIGYVIAVALLTLELLFYYRARIYRHIVAFRSHSYFPYTE